MDQSPPRYLLNRSLVIIRHQQPFLDWLQAADPNPQSDLTLDQFESDGDAFLIPGEPKVNDQAQAVKWVEKRWKGIFKYLLNDWLSDESLWPQNRSLKMFRQWFTIEYRSMVWDLDEKTPLEIEDWGDDDENEDFDQAPLLH